MTIFQAVVLGVLQGLAEFLPISSSAHLTLAPWLLGWPDPGLAVDVALHLGTLAAVLWYFRREWAALVAAATRLAARRRIETAEEQRVLYLIVATIPGAAAGLLLNDYAEHTFRAPALVASALLVMGVILWAVDRAAPVRRDLRRMRWIDAVAIGAAQAFALLPGVSRSGSTITAGRALGLDRQSAAVFSFLMSMPIIAAAALLKVPHVLRETGLSAPLVAGVVSSAVSGWMAIAFLIRYVSRNSYLAFAIYRVALGAVVLALVAARR